MSPNEVQDDPSITRLRLERKHPLAIRWMHWINFPVLLIMILSGIRIYWNTTDNAHLYPHAVYRIGIGSFTLVRLFPASVWKTLDIPWHVTQGLGDHFFFMWIFAINGAAYVLFLALSGEWRFIVPNRGSLQEAVYAVLALFNLRRKIPTQRKYNGAQRIAYTVVIAMGAGSLITGLAIYKPTQAHYLTTLLGGYEYLQRVPQADLVRCQYRLAQIALQPLDDGKRAPVAARQHDSVGLRSIDAASDIVGGLGIEQADVQIVDEAQRCRRHHVKAIRFDKRRCGAVDGVAPGCAEHDGFGGQRTQRFEQRGGGCGCGLAASMRAINSRS